MTTPSTPGQFQPGNAQPGQVGGVLPQFPQIPLGVRAELYLGAWTDMTHYIYQRNPISITRGRQSQSSTMSPSQATMELNNRDGRFTIRNPAGAWYGLIGQNTPFRLSVPGALAGAGTYLRMEDDTASYASCPDTAALDITGTLDVRIDMAPTSWAPCSLMGKWGFLGFSWALYLNGDGTVTLYFNNNSVVATVPSTAPLPNLGRIAVRAVLNPAAPSVTFYTAPTMAGTWTQLGNVVTTAPVTLISGAGQPVQVGCVTTPPASVSAGMTGQVYEAQIYSGSTLVADPVFSSQTAGVTSFTDALANVWTTHGTAELSNRLYRFHGELASLPKAADPSNTDIHSAATASGITRRQQQQQSPVQSAFYRAMVRLTGTGAPVAYWPAEDGQGATQIGAAIGTTSMGISGAPQMASNTSFACSDSIPVMNGGQFSASVNAPNGTTWSANVFRFLMAVPSGGDTNGAVIGRMYTTGTVKRLDLIYGTGGNLTLTAYDGSGNQLATTGLGVFGVNGALLRVSMELTVSGGTVTAGVVTLQVGQTNGLVLPVTLSGSIGPVTKVQANPGGLLTQTAMGHFSVAPTWDTLFDIAKPLNAWSGEAGGVRFARLCSEEGINSRIVGFPLTTTAMGNQTVQTLQQLLQEIETTDQGMMFEPRTVLGLGYVTRASLYNQPVAVTASWSGSQLAGTPEFTPTSDDQAVINDVTITNADGSSARQFLASGPMSVLPPPSGIGRVDTSITVNAGFDSDLANQAGWKLWVSTVNDDRYPVIPFNMARAQTPIGVPLLDVGSYLQVTGTPAWVPPGPVRQLAAGFKEDLGPFALWTYEVNGIPEAPYEVAVAGTGALDSAHADTAGSHLGNAIGTPDTAISAVTTIGPAWTSSGADVPFDILMAGERITVTAISPATQFLTGQNTGFEGGLGTWQAITNVAIVDTNAQAHTGVDSMQMTSVASGNMTAGHCSNANILTQGMPCQPGDLIQVTAWFRAAVTPESCFCGAVFFDVNGNPGTLLLGSAVTDSTSGWTQATATVAATGTAAFCRATVRVTTTGASEVHYVDDVTIADLTNPVQVMTVTRSVNGVVKAHLIGEAITEFRTPALAL